MIEIFALTELHCQLAEQVIERHWGRQRLRTLDSLQSAVALDLNEQGLLDTFVAADKTICEIAALEQLAVPNPEVQ